MWFLWFVITFIIAITSGSQITGVIINKNSNALATVAVSAIIVVAWLIISLAVEPIRNYWSALLIGWILGLTGAIISVKFLGS